MEYELTPQSKVEAMKGLAVIRPYNICRGQVIYRFYDRSRSGTPERGAQGGWWLEYEHFQTVKHFAQRHGYSLSYAARLFTAILYDWSGVDGFVACSARQDISCWKGRGKQIRQEDLEPQDRYRDARDFATMTPMQSQLEVYQLFVPGLSGPSSRAPSLLDVVNFGVVT